MKMPEDKKNKRSSKEVNYYYVIILISVFLMAMIWQFLLEDIVPHHFISGIREAEESIGEKWESIITSTIFTALALILPFIFLNKNILKRKLAEESLQRREGQLLAITNSTHEAIIMSTDDGKVTFWNPAAEKIFGYSYKEMEGRLLHDFIIPNKYIERHKKGFEEFRNAGKCSIINKTIKVEGLRKDGEIFPMELSISSILHDDKWHAVGTIRDISYQKKTGEGLNRLAAAIAQATEAIVITDKNAIIQYVNPAFENITGYKSQEAIGLNPSVLQSGKHDKFFYKKLWDTLKSGKTWKGRFINKKKNGDLFTEDASITPVFDASGEIVNYVAVKRDVTSDIRLERQIRQSQKMDAIGKLAGGIAHDFNNILTAIIGYTEIAKEDLPKKSESLKSIEEVLKASGRAKNLVQQILTFSRETEQELKPIQLNQIIKESLNLLRASLPATIEIQSNIEKKSDIILGDPTQISQVVMNLCTNAEYAMREKGGTLVVNLKPVEVNKEFADAHKDIKEGPYVMLTVSDTGLGMDQETIEHIFEPFFTTKPKGEGTGMGLSVVHGIVTSHGGVITVYSEVGEGTAFNIYLPRTKVERSEEEKKEVDVVPGGSETILFVDDEESIVLMSKKMLERLGYQVVCTTNPEEALDFFREAPEKFDIVLTDMRMPGKTGLELAKELFDIRNDIPVVLCTGHVSPKIEDDAGKIGIKEFINKPFMKLILANTIRRVLDESKG